MKFKSWYLVGIIILINLIGAWLIIIKPEAFNLLTSQAILNEMIWQLAGLIFAVVGGIILSQQPRQTIGWLLLLPAVTIANGRILDFFFLVRVVEPLVLDGGMFFYLWISGWTWWLLIGPLLLILQLFPTGKPITNRWRGLIYLLLGTFLFFVFVLTFYPYIEDVNGFISVPNPIGFLSTEFADAFFVVFSGFLLTNTIGAFVAIFVRYRRAELKERAQIKWLFFASLIFIIAYIPGFFSEVWQESYNSIMGFIFIFSIAAIPAAIGIAILRHNLWNIDFVINRTVVYAALSVILGGMFAGALFLISTLFNNSNATLIAGVVATAGFGAVFQPLRRRLQRFIDKRFYKIEIDYQKTPAEAQHFSAQQGGLQIPGYANLELIGRGGMAEVYRANPVAGGDPVAVKILPRDLAMDPDYRKRFDRELQVMRSLEHANIIKVLDYGEVDGLSYIVMEYIKGVDLAEHLRRVGYLQPEQALKMLIGIADALNFAHRKGLIHRDIKPSNIMLDEKQDGLRPVLMDFGIAKILGMSMMTSSGFLGTLDYISPEQIQGHEDISAQADVYSLGIMVYQMLAGAMPFQRKNPGALLLAHLTEPPPDIRNVRPEVSDQIADALMIAMSKSPAERYKTANDFVAALNIA